MRRFDSKTLVIASHNKGKVIEIEALLQPFGVTVYSAGDLKLEEPDETGQTFVENALIKARAAAEASGIPALADDSGLAAEALDGAPGLYSARWAGPDKDFLLAMNKINKLLAGNPNRKAKFVCALALVWPDGHAETFVGEVAGNLTWPPRGDAGFGYDPMFVPEEGVGANRLTFAEIAPADKHAVSHRAKAFTQMVKACFEG